MKKEQLIVALVILVIAAGAFYGATMVLNRAVTNENGNVSAVDYDAKVSKFSSAQDFAAYLASASRSSGSSIGFQRTLSPSEFMIEDVGSSVGLGAADLNGAKTTTQLDRVSTTNVQVMGIDEPDIVKTDGNELYLSTLTGYYYRADPVATSELKNSLIAPATMPPATTKLVKAFPLDSMKKDGSIDATGTLLLNNNVLMVFTNSKLLAYDVSDPAAPKELWTAEYGTNGSMVSARLKDGKLYLVTRTNIGYGQPCPVLPLKVGTNSLSVPCTDIYHPADPVAVDGIMTAMVLDPSDGSVQHRVSFVGSTYASVVYLSESSLYVANTMLADQARYFYNFLTQSAGDLIPKEVLDRLKKVMGYELSSTTKMNEFEVVMGQFQNALSDDERVKLETEISNRMKEYGKKHQREIESSSILRIDLKTLSVAATGAVPGRLLNQFSLDEHGSMLRVATTSGDAALSGSSEQSVNDVYVLDSSLKTVGSVLDLGKGERIYSVRFMDAWGYVVTFRQTDPFYVIDLSDPRAPKLSGELKIPGYSSYLDKLTDTLVLGVGQEQFKVKLSLFDVSDPTNPKEAAHYALDEYWTDVQQNHHAFLHDAKHKVFFIPSGKGGYIISYGGNQLSLKKVVSGYQVVRALYVNDLLYVVANDKVVVLDEKTWETVKELVL